MKIKVYYCPSCDFNTSGEVKDHSVFCLRCHKQLVEPRKSTGYEKGWGHIPEQTAESEEKALDLFYKDFHNPCG